MVELGHGAGKLGKAEFTQACNTGFWPAEQIEMAFKQFRIARRIRVWVGKARAHGFAPKEQFAQFLV